MLSSMRMNHPDGKRLLATVRDGDYAHAGEEEAIHLVWEGLPRNPAQPWLDAGCGRGGTAAYVRDRGWAAPTGLDIDAASVAEATTRHPGIPFVAGDVTGVGDRFSGAFEVITAFNAFYAFPDQPAALASLARAARPGAALALFDYVDRGGFSEDPFGLLPESALWRPLNLERIGAELAATGWTLTHSLCLHDAYRRWYGHLAERFACKRPELLEHFPDTLVTYATSYYTGLLGAIERGVLGGALVCAIRAA